MISPPISVTTVSTLPARTSQIYIYRSRFRSTMLSPTAEQLFVWLPTYQVIVCRKCQHAIRPSRIVRHLRRSNHQIRPSHARHIQETVLTWDRCAEDPQQLVLPISVQRPIEGLAVYTDGLLCTVTTDCGYGCRSKERFRKHWRQEHNWTTASRGRVPQQDIYIIHQSNKEARERVMCQRFFTATAGSHYIHIRNPPATSSQKRHPPPST